MATDMVTRLKSDMELYADMCKNKIPPVLVGFEPENLQEYVDNPNGMVG